MPDGIWDWLSPAPGMDGARGERLLADGRVGRLAFTWYRHGEVLTGGGARLKLVIMRDRLLLRRRPTVTLILSAEERADRRAADAIAAFRRAQGPLSDWMDRIAAVR